MLQRSRLNYPLFHLLSVDVFIIPVFIAIGSGVTIGPMYRPTGKYSYQGVISSSAGPPKYGGVRRGRYKRHN